MAQKKKAAGNKKASTQFTVDLKDINLTAKEVAGLKNAITKATVENLAGGTTEQGGATARKGTGPFVKIIFGKQTFGKRIRA